MHDTDTFTRPTPPAAAAPAIAPARHRTPRAAIDLPHEELVGELRRARQRAAHREAPFTVGLIPAHDEEDCISRAVSSMRHQVDVVVTVADNCSDGTPREARAAGATVMHSRDNPDKKAGALNQALAIVLPELADDELVLVADADSKLAPDWVEQARAYLDRPDTGAVCASFHADDSPGLISALQRNEYHRFARDNARRKARAWVLSGVASLFRAGTLREVAESRGTRLPGRSGEVYERTASTEDIELTVALRHLGYRLWTPRGCWVETDTMPDRASLRTQRLRWQRGMIDTLLLYGIGRTTWEYALRQLGMYLLSVTFPLFVLVVVGSLLGVGSVPWHPIGLLVPLILITERVWTAHPRHRLLALTFLPELAYDVVRGGWFFVALWQSLRGHEREWVPT
jgi:poly-beta-1,6-N-acetyl-D-glucosamine synthase